MFFIPDVFSPYIAGRELAIDENWDDRVRYLDTYRKELDALEQTYAMEVLQKRQPGILNEADDEVAARLATNIFGPYYTAVEKKWAEAAGIKPSSSGTGSAGVSSGSRSGAVFPGDNGTTDSPLTRGTKKAAPKSNTAPAAPQTEATTDPTVPSNDAMASGTGNNPASDDVARLLKLYNLGDAIHKDLANESAFGTSSSNWDAYITKYGTDAGWDDETLKAAREHYKAFHDAYSRDGAREEARKGARGRGSVAIPGRPNYKMPEDTSLDSRIWGLKEFGKNLGFSDEAIALAEKYRLGLRPEAAPQGQAPVAKGESQTSPSVSGTLAPPPAPQTPPVQEITPSDKFTSSTDPGRLFNLLQQQYNADQAYEYLKNQGVKFSEKNGGFTGSEQDKWAIIKSALGARALDFNRDTSLETQELERIEREIEAIKQNQRATPNKNESRMDDWIEQQRKVSSNTVAPVWSPSSFVPTTSPTTTTNNIAALRTKFANLARLSNQLPGGIASV